MKNEMLNEMLNDCVEYLKELNIEINCKNVQQQIEMVHNEIIDESIIERFLSQ